jgi:hypothetical protein
MTAALPGRAPSSHRGARPVRSVCDEHQALGAVDGIYRTGPRLIRAAPEGNAPGLVTAHPASRVQRSASPVPIKGISHRCVNGSGGTREGIASSAAPSSSLSDRPSEMPMPAALNGSATITRWRSVAWAARASLASLFCPVLEVRKLSSHVSMAV